MLDTESIRQTLAESPPQAPEYYRTVILALCAELDARQAESGAFSKAAPDPRSVGDCVRENLTPLTEQDARNWPKTVHATPDFCNTAPPQRILRKSRTHDVVFRMVPRGMSDGDNWAKWIRLSLLAHADCAHVEDIADALWVTPDLILHLVQTYPEHLYIDATSMVHPNGGIAPKAPYEHTSRS